MGQVVHPNNRGNSGENEEHREVPLFYHLCSIHPRCSWLLYTITPPSVYSPLPPDWIHSRTCMDPLHSFKTCLWDIDYSAASVWLIYSEGVQTYNNVECLDRWFCYDEYGVELLFSDIALLFFRILLLRTRTETHFDGLGQLCGDGWRRQAVWVSKTQWLFHFPHRDELSAFQCMSQNSRAERGCEGSLSPMPWLGVESFKKIPYVKSLQDNLCPSVQLNVEILS